MNEAEADFLANPRLNSSAAFGIPMRQDVQPQFVHEGHNDIGGFDVEAFFLPGHSAGSTVYKIGDALFTGDVLFQGSVGRTDLATGSWQEMMNSIRRLKSFPDALKVYPGHGPASTIGQEKRWNPYFRQS
jgi:glyoxylase-like metal-dependent hydrolase (beta-lactamase superfamily II)